MTDRPGRVCDLCGGFDDHPRHVIAHSPGAVAVMADPALVQALARAVDFATPDGAAALADLMDTSVQLRHMDCCRDAGCPDGSCGEIHASTPGKDTLRGPKLLAHLTSGAVDDIGTKLNEERAS